MSTIHLSKEIHERHISAIELCDIFLGEIIGEGISRTVYKTNTSNDYVIKHEGFGDRFQNITEWKVWNEVCNSKTLAKWFAPCDYISPNGMFLIQRRVEKLPKDKYPNEIPDFFTDVKYENFGMLNGKFVCCDYGTTLITSSSKWNGKMKKVDWKQNNSAFK